MSTWSGMRNKLETKYLAESLRGRIRYFATTYRESHDQIGRAAILLDGQEILKGNFFNYAFKNQLIANIPDRKWHAMDSIALEEGIFDEGSFYTAFSEFDNQAISKSLCSENLLVRIFAILDHRVGKRRLIAMQEQIQSETPIMQLFYDIRLEVEGLSNVIAK